MKRPGNARKALLDPAALRADERGDLSTGVGALQAALVYPNAYGVGMASLGFQLIRQFMRDSGLVQVDRAFALPDIDRPPRSFEQDRPLGDYHLLAFSVAWELDVLHILETLEHSGIPVLAAERDERHPVVVAGGCGAALNPQMLAPFVDVLIAGRDMHSLHSLLEICAQHPPGAERAELLAALNAGGAENQDNAVCAASEIVSPHAEFGERVLVEIARGCANRCGFCWLGHNSGAFRPWSSSEVLDAFDKARGITGCNRVGLIASAVGAHPEIDVICEGLMQRGTEVSFSSLRAEDVTGGMLEALRRSGQRGITLAPEAGSDALRCKLGKPLETEGFLRVAEQAQRSGMPDLKLYFMLGLPDETDEDAAAIVEFCSRAREALVAHGGEHTRPGGLSVNLGIYVPKPGTPLARKERPDWRVVRARLREVSRRLRAMPNVRVAAPGIESARAQEILSNAGERGADLALHALRAGGNWKRALREWDASTENG